MTFYISPAITITKVFNNICLLVITCKVKQIACDKLNQETIAWFDDQNLSGRPIDFIKASFSFYIQIAHLQMENLSSSKIVLVLYKYIKILFLM